MARECNGVTIQLECESESERVDAYLGLTRAREYLGAGASERKTRIGGLPWSDTRGIAHVSSTIVADTPIRDLHDRSLMLVVTEKAMINVAQKTELTKVTTTTTATTGMRG